MHFKSTAIDALKNARLAYGLPLNPAGRSIWSFNFLGLTLTLPNFSWRRDAIDRHDVHHLMLNEPFNLKGECQVATWEFAAGPHSDFRAQLFCLPLVALGAVAAPRATWCSYLKGSGHRGLYHIDFDERLSIGDLEELSATLQPLDLSQVKLRFAALVTASISLYILPAALLFTITALLV